MQSRYTQNALQVQKLAREAARECGHSYAGSEHLLIGLLREPEGTGRREASGLDRPAYRPWFRDDSKRKGRVDAPSGRYFGEQHR